MSRLILFYTEFVLQNECVNSITEFDSVQWDFVFVVIDFTFHRMVSKDT